MTDDDAKRLRELAERARGNNIGAVSAMATLGGEYEAILALLDTVEALRRERDTLVAACTEWARKVDTAAGERDAAMALLKKHGIDYEP